MAIVSVDGLGAVGVLPDLLPHRLPPNAWSACRNMRFEHGEATRVGGYQLMTELTGEVIWALPVQFGDFAYWITTSTNKIYAWDGTTNAEITPTSGPVPGSIDDLWNGGVFAGIAVLNNGAGIPLYWVPNTARAAQLTNWPTTWRAQVIRPYKNQLIAMNLIENGVPYPNKYAWSDTAEPGALPTWDVADPASQAGFDVLEETQGVIIDGEPLRDYFVLYKDDSCFLLQYVGGQFVVVNRMLLKTRGMLAQRCAKEFYGRHFVVSNGDVFVHDGQTAQSVADAKVRREIFDKIDNQFLEGTFVAPNYQRDEMWVCYNTNGSRGPNKAAIWNWTDNTWGFRELPEASHIAYGVLPSVVQELWSTATGTWETDTLTWSQRLYNPADRQLVMLTRGPGLSPSATLTPSGTLTPSAGASGLYAMDIGMNFTGVDGSALLERVGLKPEKGNGVFMLRAAYPRGDGGQIGVQFGSHDSPQSPVTWGDSTTFELGAASDKIDARITGRYLAVRITAVDANALRLEGMDLDIVKVGSR